MIFRFLLLQVGFGNPQRVDIDLYIYIYIVCIYICIYIIYIHVFVEFMAIFIGADFCGLTEAIIYNSRVATLLFHGVTSLSFGRASKLPSPSLKLTWPLKIDDWNTTFLLVPGLLSGALECWLIERVETWTLFKMFRNVLRCYRILMEWFEPWSEDWRTVIFCCFFP